MKSFISILCAGLVLLGAAHAASWSPLQVDVWEPAFNTERKHQVQTYTALDKAQKKWRICVSIPHLKDTYWLAVNYGLIEEARRLGVAVTIQEAGGYDKPDVQRKQIEACMANQADALVVGAIAQDGLSDLIKRYTDSGRPVVDLINGIRSPQLTARVAADFFEMGQLAGESVKKDTKGGRVLWMPGPKGAGWAEAGNAGFAAALAGSKWVLAETLWGDTGVAAQAALLSAYLDKHQDVGFVVGTAVSAEAAVQELRRRNLSDKVKVVSYYFSPVVYRAIERGNIDAAPSDVPTLQSRLALDLAVRILEKKPYPKHLAARLQVIDRSNVKKIELRDSLAPDGFRPIFNVD